MATAGVRLRYRRPWGSSSAGSRRATSPGGVRKRYMGVPNVGPKERPHARHTHRCRPYPYARCESRGWPRSGGKKDRLENVFVPSLTSCPLYTPKALPLGVITRHWEVENKGHWVLDTVSQEDRSRARTRTLPLALTLLRQAVMTLLRSAGWRSITEARSYFCASPALACSLLGVPYVRTSEK